MTLRVSRRMLQPLERLAAFGLLFVVASVCSRAFAQELVRVPGTTVSLAPPAGFVLSRTFAGLENAQTGSSITIAEFSAEAYAELAPLFASLEAAREAWGARGISVDSLSELSIGERRVPLLTGTQPAGRSTFKKYIAVLTGEKTVLVTLNIANPQELPSDKAEQLVRSIRLDRAATIAEQIVELPFTFSAAAPFKTRGSPGLATALLTIADGPDPSGLSPIVVIARAVSPVESSRTAELGALLLRTLEGFERTRARAEARVPFAGGSGHYATATVGDITVKQWLVIPEDGYYLRVVARGETAALEQVLPAVEEIVESVRTK